MYAHTLSFCVWFASIANRAYAKSHQINEKLVFNVNDTEKGKKVIATAEILFKLDPGNGTVTSLMADMKDDDVRKVCMSSDILPADDMDNLRLFFWGDVSNLVSKLVAILDLGDGYVWVLTSFDFSVLL